MKDVMGKFLNMRKPQGFTVYPRPTNVPDSYNLITVQSDKSIGKFDIDTGIGILNGKPFTFPMEFVEACKEAQPKKGDKIHGVIVIG